MRWSKLKQLVESRFAPEVAGRVELRTTRYEKEADRFGRSWISIDGKEIINMSTFLRVDGKYMEAVKQDDRFRAGVFAGYDLGCAMHAFLNLPIDTALTSENPLIRCLAVLDRRVGARRLARLDIETEPAIVAKLLAFRLDVREGVTSKNRSTSSRVGPAVPDEESPSGTAGPT